MMQRPLIGIDARVGRHTSVGAATYNRELAKRLPAVAPNYDFRIYSDGGTLDLSEQLAIPARIRRDRPALVHFLQHYMPLSLPRTFLFTIHDLIHMRFLHMFKAYIGPYYRNVVRRAAGKAARIITSDEMTIPDIVHYLGVDAGKIRVVPLAPRERFMLQAAPHVAKRPYFINAGNHREHKDIPTLLRAWAALPPSYEVDLYLTGPDDFGGELQRLSNDRREAVALGNVTDDALASYYAGAAALVHPALLEGFGLPFVEAMACGCPVIATRQSLPSVARDASIAFAAGNAEEARDAMQRLLDDQALRTSLVERGKRAAMTLSWDRTARETADIYAEVLMEDPR